MRRYRDRSAVGARQGRGGGGADARAGAAGAWPIGANREDSVPRRSNQPRTNEIYPREHLRKRPETQAQA